MEIIGNGMFSMDLTRLREEGRPLWMSPLGIEAFAEMLGGGGDIYTDRLIPEWSRFSGRELSDGEESLMEAAGGESAEGAEFSPKSELAATVEEAFRYVHSLEE